jgi:hypothetical protein
MILLYKMSANPEKKKPIWRGPDIKREVNT